MVESSRGEPLRLAFRALAQGDDRELVQEILHRIWRQQEPEAKQALLRELPNSRAWTAFEQDWLIRIEEADYFFLK